MSMEKRDFIWWLLKFQVKKNLEERYILKEHIADEEIGTVYALADMVIGRASANTFSELIALRKPAVLIPLPWSAHGEQQKHAKF